MSQQQETIQKPSNKTTETVGELETKAIARDLATTVEIDGESYTIQHDTDVFDVTNTDEAETVKITTPCKYCDTKLEFEYSGTVPEPITGICSHCGESVDIIKNGNLHGQSPRDILRSIKLYQRRRAAYIEGQHSQVSLDPKSVSIFQAVVGSLIIPMSAFSAMTVPNAVRLGIGLNSHSVFALICVVGVIVGICAIGFGSILGRYLGIPEVLEARTVSDFLESANKSNK